MKSKAHSYPCDLCTFVVPPIVQGWIAGAKYAKVFSTGLVELTYFDETTESAQLTTEQLAQGRENFFALVSAVQSYRKPSC